MKVLVKAGATTQLANESEILLTTAVESKLPTETIKYLIEKGTPVDIPKGSTTTL